MRPAIQDLLTGYYGWRAGKLSTLTFPDGTSLRIAPGLNAGSVALQYFFSRHLNYADWLQAINPDTGFLSLYKSMFGDPWERANELGPLFPPNLIQPAFTLPFEVGAPVDILPTARIRPGRRKAPGAPWILHQPGCLGLCRIECLGGGRGSRADRALGKQLRGARPGWGRLRADRLGGDLPAYWHQRPHPGWHLGGCRRPHRPPLLRRRRSHRHEPPYCPEVQRRMGGRGWPPAFRSKRLDSPWWKPQGDGTLTKGDQVITEPAM